MALPLEVLGLVFAHLDARDLQRCARVSHGWRAAAEDRLLWDALGRAAERHCLSLCSCCLLRVRGLRSDVRRRFALHLPDRGIVCERRAVESPLTCLVLRPLGRAPASSVVLFGSGLEVPGSGLVSRLMWGDRTSPFRTLAALPGGELGIGGGVRLAFKGRTLDLITLYRHNKTAREMRTADGVPVVLTNHTIDDVRARGATLAICHRAHAFVYAYDASLPLSDAAVRDFHVLVPPGRADVPVLVLLLVRDLASVVVTCNELMLALGLQAAQHRWWILVVDGFSLSQLERGFEWLLPRAWWP